MIENIDVPSYQLLNDFVHSVEFKGIIDSRKASEGIKGANFADDDVTGSKPKSRSCMRCNKRV